MFPQLIVCLLIALAVTGPRAGKDSPARCGPRVPMAPSVRPAVVPVLCYHRFADRSDGGMTIGAAEFERQLRRLSSGGFRTVSLDVFEDLVAGRRPAPAFRPVLITVDDGYRSFSEIAAPLLKKHGFSAVLFVYTDYISRGRQAMTWADLRACAAGGFEIASHSVSHPNFASARRRMDPADFAALLRRELAGSRERIERETGRRVTAFAAPYGVYDNDVRAAAREAGYRLFFTINAFPNTRGTDPFALGRFLVAGDFGMADFECRINSLPLTVSAVTPGDGERVSPAGVAVRAVISDAGAGETAVEMSVGSVRASVSRLAEDGSVGCRVPPSSGRTVYPVTIRVRDAESARYRYHGWLFQRPPAARSDPSTRSETSPASS